MNEFELRRALRQLPPEREPGRDLWPQIATETRIAGRAAINQERKRRRLPFALAASIGLAALIGVQLEWAVDAPLPVDSPHAVRAELAYLPSIAGGLEAEYRAARASLPAELPLELQPVANELDASAFELRAALRQQPHSVFLLAQLRRVHDLRLQLARGGRLG